MNISKKTAIILILGTVILLLGLFLYFYLSPTDQPQTDNTSTSTPFGDTSKPSTNPIGVDATKPATSTPITPDKSAETLRQIFAEPISGSIIYTKNKDTVVRFVERSNGNIYEVKKDSPQVIRLTNKTIPKIQEAIWDSGGNYVVFRYLNEDEPGQIDSFASRIRLSTSTSNEFFGDITGSFLPTNIPQLVASPVSGEISYFQKKINGSGSNIFVVDADGTDKTQIADISLSEITLFWPKESTIAILTKPSNKYAGFLYFMNAQGGSLRKIIGNIWGLSTLVNRQADKVVYSRVAKSQPILNLYDINKGEDTNLQIKTLADKCVWGKKYSSTIYCAVPSSIPNGEYPDNWYQGTISFTDNIWKIDIENGRSTIIYDMISKNLSIDAMSLTTSDQDDFLVFTNKKDLSLWGLILE